MEASEKLTMKGVRERSERKIDSTVGYNFEEGGGVKSSDHRRSRV